MIWAYRTNSKQTVPHLRWLQDGFSSWSLCFNPGWVHVMFVVDNVTLGCVFELLRLSTASGSILIYHLPLRIVRAPEQAVHYHILSRHLVVCRLRKGQDLGVKWLQTTGVHVNGVRQHSLRIQRCTGARSTGAHPYVSLYLWWVHDLFSGYIQKVDNTQLWYSGNLLLLVFSRKGE